MAQDAPSTSTFVGRCVTSPNEGNCIEQALGLGVGSTPTSSVGVSVTPSLSTSNAVVPGNIAPDSQAVTPSISQPLLLTPLPMPPQPSSAQREPAAAGGDSLGTFINGGAAGSRASASDRRTDPLEDPFE
ncbi:MAG TPA: hypothetical protein VH934_01880 [Xanthobacteraceae bacterium]|jgi:hypothetical protein